MKRALIAALFMLMLAVNAFALDLAMYSETSTVFMGSNDSIGVQITIENSGEAAECLTLTGDTDSLYIEAEPSLADICLNAGERTNVTLNIRTIDAPSSGYFAFLFAEAGIEAVFYVVEVKTVSEPEVELIVYEGDICRGEQDYFSVLVKNNSNELKEIRLWADNEMLLPYFEPQEIVLDAFEEEYVKVYVHPGRGTLLGDYRVSLFAEAEEEQVKETAFIDVKDCLDEEIDFIVEFSSGCQYAEKGEEERVSYTVRNLSGEELELKVAVVSDLPTEYDSTILLEENEEKTFRIYVTPRFDDDTGRHDLTLIVWDPATGRNEEKTKCIYVREIEATEIELLENDLKIEQCLSEVFTLIVKNTGDTELDYRINIAEDFDGEGISIDVSDERFELDSKEQKYIYISVSSTEDTPLGEYSFEVIVKFNGESITKTLEFEVVEKLPFSEDLEIVSYPLQVKAIQGEETTFIVSIENNSEHDMEGITVQLVGLPSGAFAPSLRDVSLKAGHSKDVQLYITTTGVEEGIYKANIEAKTDEFKTSREIEFVVEAAAEEEELGEGLLAGLFFVGSNVLLGLIVLAIAIALIVLIEKALRGYSSKKQPKEVWLRG